MKKLNAVILPALSQPHKATLIFLHGLGDSGHGWSQMFADVRQLFPHHKFIFPHAPQMPVTLNGGMSMPAWYDIYSMSDLSTASRPHKEDMDGLGVSCRFVEDIVKNEMQEYGIKSDNIIVGGFSQGGAVALHCLLKSQLKFGGGIVMSSYLMDSAFYKKADPSTLALTNKDTPIFMAHGTADQVVRFDYGKQSFDVVKQQLGFSGINFKAYQRMQHSSCEEETEDLLAFIKSLPIK